MNEGEEKEESTQEVSLGRPTERRTKDDFLRKHRETRAKLEKGLHYICSDDGL